MKINQDIQSPSETSHRQLRETTDHKYVFKKIVQSQTNQLQNQEIEELMNALTQQGNKLARFRSFRDLAKFKHIVKRILKETTANGLKKQSGHHFHPSGQTKKLSVVKEVDEKLIELTDAVINQEKKTVDLLDVIGEIKGLLLNLYM